MNCVDFRRQLRTDPRSRDSAFLCHARDCERCAALAAPSAHFERQLKAALEVDVPDDIAARVLVGQRLDSSLPPARRHGPVLALAASVLLVAGLLVGLLASWKNRAGLEHVVLELVQEDYALIEAGGLQSTPLAATLEPLGAELRGELANVTFSRLCSLRDKMAAHLILAGERGRVSVLIMPGQSVPQRTSIDDDLANGLLAPIPGGSLAIVGRQGEPLDRIESEVRAALSLSAK